MSELTITKKLEGNTLTVFTEGRIDTNTAARFSEEINESLSIVTELILDFEKVSYISSSALRILLSLNNTMTSKGGKLILRKPTDMVYDVLDMTGFADVLTIER